LSNKEGSFTEELFSPFRGEVENIQDLFINLINFAISYKKSYELEKISFRVANLSQVFSIKEISIEDKFYREVYSSLLEGHCILKKWFSAYNLVILNKERKLINRNTLKEITLEDCFLDKLRLEIDLIRNNILSSEKEFDERLNRLLIVQMEKKQNPNLLEGFNKEITYEDTFSETGSVISSSSSHNSQKSKKSNASKMTKKAKNKFSKRTIKEGSPLEEEFIMTVLKELKENFINLNYEKDLEEFLSVMFIYGYIEEAKEIKVLFNNFKEKLDKTFPLYNVFQQEFMNKNPECKLIFSNLLETKPKENK